MELDLICPERVRLLRFAKEAISEHSGVVVCLRDVSGRGCPEIFEALMGEVTVSSMRVKRAFKAYTELRRDGMGGQFHVVRSADEAYAMLGVSAENFSQRLFPEELAA